LEPARPSLLDEFDPHARSLLEVLERMRLIEAALPTLDGVAWFNKMYLHVTENVAEAIAGRSFKYPKFMEALTITFANLYLQAVDDDLHRPASVPKAWAPLFQSRLNRKVAPIQFALAGMNAHINRDLAIAVVATCRKLRATPSSRRRRDYDLVTGILANTVDDVKRWFATGFLELLDFSFGRVDDVIAIFSIRKARETAWLNAQVLWELRDLGAISSVQLANIDHLVGLAGRGLLVPTAV
jgi:hypothetical protein